MLEIREGTGPARSLELDGEETLIGRDLSCQIRLTDTGASREHAAISWEDGQYLIEDLQSTNGTKVNGKRVRSARLSDGDQIEIGRAFLTLRLR